MVHTEGVGLAFKDQGDYDFAASSSVGFRPRKPDTLARPTSRPVNWARISVIAVLGIAAVGWYDRSRLPDMISAADADIRQNAAATSGKIDVVLDVLLKKSVSQNSPEGLRDGLDTAKQLLASAQRRNIVLSPEVISEVGSQILQRSAAEPSLTPVLWDTATQFLNYRTFINSQTGRTPVLPTASEQVKIRFAPGESGTVSGYIFENKEITLDNGRWDNVVFSNCTIVYQGGPMNLKNGYFVNCRFVIAPSDNGRTLAQSILTGFPSTVSQT